MVCKIFSKIETVEEGGFHSFFVDFGFLILITLEEVYF